MFNRIEFKNTAKRTLNGNWKIPCLITLLVLLVNLIFKLPAIYTYINLELSDSVPKTSTSIDFINNLVDILVNGIFSIALSYFYLTITKDKTALSFQTFFEGLNFWAKGITVALLKTLFITLWSLLLIIPGIIKSLAYSQMEFIAAENPSISTKKVMKMSIAMTEGYKGDIFLLQLSFIGWALLAILTLGIGYIFLEPYIYCTNTNVYYFLKSRALENGTLTYSDFGMQEKIPETTNEE
ncbi:MAG: hypothetical protein BKP49_06540 [Treponema sp. CETP13]|nr:MAG: hypothetical protein BKP49_06540 [Treponema sp. CETP13]